MFGRVSVLLDELAPASGAFACAREWAERLHKPLQTIDLPKRATEYGTFSSAVPVVPWHQDGRRIDCGETADVSAGARSGSSKSDARSRTDVAPATEKFDSEHGPGPADLWVFGRSLPNGLQTNFMRSARAGTSLLTCPDQWEPLSRLLVLHENGDDGPFVRSAVRLCTSLGAQPIVLTVARSERIALIREQRLREALNGQGLDCDFDQLAGFGMGSAALRGACWRRCQVVVVRRRPGRSWWPWGRGETLEQLTTYPSPFAFLALPEGGLLEPAPVSGVAEGKRS